MIPSHAWPFRFLPILLLILIRLALILGTGKKVSRLGLTPDPQSHIAPPLERTVPVRWRVVATVRVSFCCLAEALRRLSSSSGIPSLLEGYFRFCRRTILLLRGGRGGLWFAC